MMRGVLHRFNAWDAVVVVHAASQQAYTCLCGRCGHAKKLHPPVPAVPTPNHISNFKRHFCTTVTANIRDTCGLCGGAWIHRNRLVLCAAAVQPSSSYARCSSLAVHRNNCT